MSNIPSYGALILDEDLREILLNVYVNPSEQVMPKLDFPKGKINEGESGEECAIREIKEEIAFDVTPYLVEDRYICMQTNRGKYIKLFIIMVPKSTISLTLKD